MKVHHTGHHQAYVNGLNGALATLKEASPELAALPLDALLKRISEVCGARLGACACALATHAHACPPPLQAPEKLRGPLRNHGGGFVNHKQFFTLWMAPPGGAGVGPAPPAGPLADALASTFGTLDKFKEDFSAAATTVFGSGWAWLIVDKTSGAPVLRVVATPNQDTPAMEAGKHPILGLDVWEHAYCA